MDGTPDGPQARGAPLRLSPFDWSGFVADNFSLSFLAGTAGAGIGVVAIDAATLPRWMVFSVALTLLSLVLAFTRVWKTIREEHETSSLWEQLVPEVSPRGATMGNVRDAVFEVPYVLAILVLPFSVVLFQAFGACLLLFYVCDNYYNLALVRGIGTDASARLPSWLKPVTAFTRGIARTRLAPASPALGLIGAALETPWTTVDPLPSTIDRAVLMRFFGARARLDRVAIWILLVALVVGTLVAVAGAGGWAVTIALVAVIAILVLELLVEPFRALGVQYSADGTDDAGEDRFACPPLVWTVPAGAKLDRDTVEAVEALHAEAFQPAERQYTVARPEGPPRSTGAPNMLDLAGRRGFQLLLLTCGGGPSQERSVGGYLFLEARPEREVAFVWYLAIEPQQRGQGLGSRMMRDAIDIVRERWPAVRGVLLEVTRPDQQGETYADDMRRVHFYQRQGFRRATELDYAIPAADDRAESLFYDPMFRALDPRIDEALDGTVGEEIDRRIGEEFVKAAVLEMARDNFAPAMDDPRWTALRQSLRQMRLVPPGEGT